MKKIIFTLPILLFVFCQCDKKNIRSESKQKSEFASDSLLRTGWYYIADLQSGFLKELYKDTTGKKYYIDPHPIVTADNFSSVKFYEATHGEYYGLTIKLDSVGTELWRIATGKSIGKPLGLIIDNVLVECPIVQSEIPNGTTGLNRADLTKNDVITFEKMMQVEMEK